MSEMLPDRPRRTNVPYRLRRKLSTEMGDSIPKMVAGKASMSYPKLKISLDRPLNDTLIIENMDEIHQMIIDVISSLATFVSMDQYSWPQLADTHIWFKELHELFDAGLGLEEGEMLDSAFRRLEVDTKQFSTYARMLTVVGVHQNVLDASWPQIPILDLSWARHLLKPVLEELETKSQQNLPTVLLKSLAADEVLNARLAAIPEKFGRQLLDDMIPMFVSFSDQSVERGHSSARTEFLWKRCGQTLVDIFRTALTLRLEMTFKEAEYQYSFFWPQAGQPFNGKYMDVEIDKRRVSGKKSAHDKPANILMTLLPGVSRLSSRVGDSIKDTAIVVSKIKTQSSDMQEKVIVPALVFLGEKAS